MCSGSRGTPPPSPRNIQAQPVASNHALTSTAATQGNILGEKSNTGMPLMNQNVLG